MNSSKSDYFIQVPFFEFARKCPEVARQIPMYELFLSDPRYLVRIVKGKIEIGFTEDAWSIH